MVLLSAGLVVIFSLSFVHSQDPSRVIPTSYSFTDGMPMNGSFATGNCSQSLTSGTITCTDPTSSVLYDGHIPTLTGLDGDMWASKLLTLHTHTTSTDIDFYFNAKLTLAKRVEVVMFNCPKWGIGVQTVRLLDQGDPEAMPIKVITPNITSCDSLVRVCLSVRIEISQFTLEFTLSFNSDWVHLAEVTFYESGNTCPPDTIITASSSSTATSLPSSSLPSTTDPAMNKTITNSIPVAVAMPVTLLLLLVVVVMTAVLILWRCKHHTSHHTVKEEASHTTSHTHPHTHPPAAAAAVSLCEETGQVHYASLDQDTHTYASIPSQASKEKQEAKHPNVYPDMMYDTPDLPSALYSSIAETKTMTLQGVDIPKETSRRNKMNDLQFSETSVDQLYAQVDNEKNSNIPSSFTTENPSSQPPDPEPPVNQLYAQVNKKKKKVVCVEARAVYSVVNKPSPPQLPPKSQLLMEELA